MTLLPDTDTNNDKRGNGMFRPIILAVLVGSALFLSVFFLASPDAFSQKNTATDRIPSPGVATLSAEVINPRAKRYDFRLDWDDSVYGILSSFDVPGQKAYNVVKRAGQYYDLRALKKGEVLRVYAVENSIALIEYRINDYEILVVKRDDSDPDGFSVSRKELTHETRVASASGAIESSLYEDGAKAGLDIQAILAFSDIFAWDVDFASDIRKGDTFKIYYETLYVDGRLVRTGKILAAEMVNDGREYRAFYFADANGKGGYYDEEGKSVRRMLLKSPLRFSRITSRFTNRRFHPILKYYRPHHGIDYAAPAGTPVDASGNGRVVFAGWKSGYGNFIELKHPNGYVTGYGHLSKIKKGIRPGVSVEQGETIGFVGSTGISTGPHLHYEIKSNGALMNPLKIKAEPNKSISKSEMARFEPVKEGYLKRLAGILTPNTKTRLASIR